MKRVAWAACVAASLVAFSGVSSAGQDRAQYPAAGGPGQGGVIRNILFSGANMFAAVEGGGIYKSTDGGASWSASHQGIVDRVVRVVQRDSANLAIMYAATLQGGGFYKSTDGGATWAPSNAGLNCVLLSGMFVATAAPNAGRVYVSTTCGGTVGGVYTSTDQGASWTRLGGATMPGNVSLVGISGTPDGVTLRATGTGGVLVSLDSGATWQLRNGTLPNVLSSPPGIPLFVGGTVFAGANLVALVDGNGAFYSGDLGVNWFQSTGLPAGANTQGVFTVDTNAWVVVDGAGLYKSMDGGVTWAPDASLNGLPIKSTRFFFRAGAAGAPWWAATFSGVYKSNDGLNWTRQSTGLPQGFVVNATSHPSTPQVMFAAADTIYKSTDGGATWAPSDTGLGGVMYVSYFGGRFGVVQVDPGNPAVVYASTVNMGMFKSTDTGATWAPINNGLPASHAAHGGNFRISISNPNVLYLPLGQVGSLYKTTDGGANWTDVSIPGQFARAPGIDPTNADIVYVATSGGLYKSTTGGSPGSWVQKNPGGIAFNVGRPQVMSGAPQNVLLAVFNADSRGVANSVSGVYLSTNGGDTWKQLAANEKVTQAIFVNTPGSSKVGAYVVTLGGFDDARTSVFKCEDLFGDSWEPNTHCREVDLGPDAGQPRSFLARTSRMVAIATSSGLAKHRFLYLGQDFNNDGRSDIFWRNTSGANAIWHMNGSGFFDDSGVQTLSTVGSPWVVAGFGDFDGNGTSDVLWRNTSSGENYVYLMDGATILSEGFIRTVADMSWSVAGVGDFDRDGKSDILWRNGTSGDNYVFFMDSLQIVNEGYVRSVPDTNWSVAAVGDFNGDFRADVLWRNASTGENYVYQMDGLTIVNEGYIRSVPAAWTVKGLGDFNLDNKMDIVWRNASNGENYVYPMDGLTILPEEGYLPTVSEAGWNIAAVGDFDAEHTSIPGRGHSDILWRNSTSGAAYLWKMSGPTSIVALCGAMGCQSGFLPLVGDTNWQIMNR